MPVAVSCKICSISQVFFFATTTKTSATLQAFSCRPQGASVNAAKLHETALHHAAKVKHVDLIDLLVEFGGNLYATDNLGKKPIHYTSIGSPTHLCLEFYESKSDVTPPRYF